MESSVYLNYNLVILALLLLKNIERFFNSKEYYLISSCEFVFLLPFIINQWIIFQIVWYVVRERLESVAQLTCGFDLEWPVSFTSGSQHKTALIQFCPSSQVCYLFHVSLCPYWINNILFITYLREAILLFILQIYFIEWQNLF